MGSCCVKADDAKTPNQQAAAATSVTQPQQHVFLDIPAPGSSEWTRPSSKAPEHQSARGNTRADDGSVASSKSGRSAASRAKVDEEDTRVLESIERKKRLNVVAESYLPWSPGPLPTNSQRPTATVRKMLLKTLETHFMFHEVSKDTRIHCVDQMIREEHSIDTKVVVQGDEGDRFFIVERGRYEVWANGKLATALGPGQCFGDLALVMNAPRAATVKAVERGICWSLNRGAFRQALFDMTMTSREHIVDFLKNVPLLNRMNASQRNALADQMAAVTFEPGKKIVTQGSVGNVFYILQQGTVNVTKDHEDGSEKHIMTMHSGDYFGEGALVCPGQPRAANVVSGDRGAAVLALNREDFQQHMGELIRLLEVNFYIRVLKGVDLFKNLSLETLHALADVMAPMDVEPGEAIIKQGDSGDDFYIVLEGRVSVLQRKSDGIERELAQLSSGSFFGEMALLKNAPRMASVVAMSPARVVSLARPEFESLLGSLLPQIKKEAEEREKRNDPKNKSARAKKEHSDKIDPAGLEVLKELGSGSFGKVVMVRDAKTEKLYALKRILKAGVVRKKMQKYVNQERHIMSLLDHPFVCKMHASFQDDANLCVLLDLIQGVELYQRMEQAVSLDNKACQFYVAQVVLALEHCHEKKVGYRDLKPENIMIDLDGYIKVVDFGLSAIMMNKSFTICGTPEYMAPEIVLGKGYSKAVDIWALGVLLYELSFGKTPFNPSGEASQIEICQNIVKGKFQMDKSTIVSDCADLIEQLLTLNPTSRLGCGPEGWEGIKKHPWFRDLDWQRLLLKELPSPWKPKVSSVPKMPSKRLAHPDPPFKGDNTQFAAWK